MTMTKKADFSSPNASGLHIDLRLESLVTNTFTDCHSIYFSLCRLIILLKMNHFTCTCYILSCLCVLYVSIAYWLHFILLYSYCPNSHLLYPSHLWSLLKQILFIDSSVSTLASFRDLRVGDCLLLFSANYDFK